MKTVKAIVTSAHTILMKTKVTGIPIEIITASDLVSTSLIAEIAPLCIVGQDVKEYLGSVE